MSIRVGLRHMARVLGPVAPPKPPVEETLFANKDAVIGTLYPNINEGDIDHNKTNPRSGRTYRSLIGFDLSGIPAGATILSAIFKLQQAAGQTFTPGRTLVVQRVTGAWTEMGVTWNNQPTVDETTVEVPSPEESGEWLEWDVTGIFLLDDEISFRLKDKNEGTAENKYNFFWARGMPGTDKDPRLVIVYI